MSGIELIPLGASELERAGIAFVDEPGDEHLAAVLRRRATMPTSAEVVTFKHESTRPVAGPVWIDGAPVAEIDFHFDGETRWSTAWYTRVQARQIAHSLGARLEEV